MDFSVYLAREAHTFESVLSENTYLNRTTVAGVQMGLATEQKAPRPPKWSTFLQSAFSGIEQLHSQGCRALLLLEIDSRIILIPFGQGGRFLFSQDAVEPGFGLRVTAAATAPGNLRAIDVHSFGARRVKSRHQSSGATAISGFTVDPERDFVRAVAGQVVAGKFDPFAINALQGADSLRFRCKIGLSDLPDLCRNLLDHFLDPAAFKNFPALTKLQELKSAESEACDSTLLSKISNGDADVSLDFEPFDTLNRLLRCDYTIGQGENPPDETLDQMLKKLNTTVPLKQQLKAISVFRREDEENLVRATHLYNCVSAQMVDGDQTFLLHQGIWYRVDRDFLVELYDDISKIPSSTLSLDFDYVDEDGYNKALAHDLKAILLDKSNIAPRGQDKIEPCDVLEPSGRFIHVKRGTESSKLSHLFNQGQVSGEILAELGGWECLKRTKKTIPSKPDRPWTVSYVVLSERTSDSVGPQKSTTLPFFSLISLRRACRHLQRMSFNVTVDVYRTSKHP